MKAKRNALIISSSLSSATLEFIRSAILNELRKNSFFAGDGQVKRALSAYKLPIAEYLLTYLQPMFEVVIRKKIVPTFSYCRIYQAGDFVELHRDREEAEFTASLMIAASGPDAEWGFLVKTENGLITHSQKIGDCILLNGAEVIHGRPPYAGIWCATIILCYVSDRPEMEKFFGDQSKIGL